MEAKIENINFLGGYEAIGQNRPYIDKDGISKISVYQGGNIEDEKNYKVFQANTTALFLPEEWKEIDKTLREAASSRLVGVQDLIDNGLVYNLANPFASDVYEYIKVSDSHDANVSINFKTEGSKGKEALKTAQVPVPVISWVWDFDMRDLQKSRAYGRNLDLQGGKYGARKIAEKLESMLFNGIATKLYDKKIDSLISFSDTNVYSAFHDWTLTTVTGADILSDVAGMKAMSIADKHYGPWMLYISPDFESRMDDDYGLDVANKTYITLKQRILGINGIKDVKTADFLPSKTAVLVQLSEDTIQLIKGTELTTIQWENKGNMLFSLMTFAIQSVAVKSDFEGNCGIVVGSK